MSQPVNAIAYADKIWKRVKKFEIQTVKNYLLEENNMVPKIFGYRNFLESLLKYKEATTPNEKIRLEDNALLALYPICQNPSDLKLLRAKFMA